MLLRVGGLGLALDKRKDEVRRALDLCRSVGYNSKNKCFVWAGERLG
jgi:hypothetical protein